MTDQLRHGKGPQGGQFAPMGRDETDPNLVEPITREDIDEELVNRYPPEEQDIRYMVHSSDGKEWVELARRFRECCEGQSNTPAFDLVEQGEVKGAYNGQCGQCGTNGAGWAYTGAHPLDLNQNLEEQIDDMEAELKTAWKQENSDHMERLTQDGKQALSTAVKVVRGAGLDPERLSWDDWQNLHDENFDLQQVATLSDTEPGVYLDGSHNTEIGRLCYYSYVPNNADGLFVHMDDLEEAK